MFKIKFFEYLLRYLILKVEVLKFMKNMLLYCRITILRPFSSTCLRYNEPNTDGFNENKAIEVYNGPLSLRIRSVKLFSLMTSVTGLVAQPLLIEKASEGNTHIAVLIGVATFVGFFTFVTPILLHIITKTYVRKMYYDPNTESYLATTYTLFLKDKKVIFKPQDVDVPDVPGMFTSFKANGVPLFVELSQFKDASHYKRIMGYDKPLDFKIEEAKKTT